tara:strand:- start:7352 stop:8065 length:714 start_codon:yes stop_codon:yes gene_type:complete
MATIAGMDLGYGSQVKVVRTNYLVLRDDADATVAGCKNTLTLFQGALSGTILQPEYVAATAGITSSTDPTVLLSAMTACPMVGPQPGALHQASGIPTDGTVNAAYIGNTSNGEILTVLSANFALVTTVGATYATFADTSDWTIAPQTGDGVGSLTDDGFADNLNADILNINANNQGLLDLSDIKTDIGSMSAEADLSVAALNADFVAPGNAAGSTPSAIGAGQNAAIISVVALVKTV